MESKPKFRVIIVGGGPAGLAMAHGLCKANIDYVLIERHPEIVYESGNGIGIWPQVQRFLDQIGCLEALEAMADPLNMSYNRLPDGKALAISPMFDMVKERHGYRFLLTERHQFIEVLYNGLLDKSKLMTGCSVESIKQDEDGVRVYLDSGAVETGDIVVGADGVHSLVRTIMWEHANQITPGIISESEKTSLLAEYKCLFGISTNLPNAPPGEMTVTHNSGFSFLTLTQTTRIIWFLFIKLKNPIRYPTRIRYTETDAEEVAVRYGQFPISEQLHFKELWDHRVRATLSPLEEGLFKHWYSGRIVLVGDSAHKMTPNLAFGANNAIESAVALSNKLYQALHAHSKLDEKLNQETITSLFRSYQQSRVSRAKKSKEMTGMNTRMQAWDGWFWKFFVKHLMLLVGDKFVVDQFASIVKGGVKLDYVELKNLRRGLIPWSDEAPQREESQSRLSMVVCWLKNLVWRKT